MSTPRVSARESDQFAQLDPDQQELIYSDIARNGVVDDGTPLSINFNNRGKAITGPVFASDTARAPAAVGPLSVAPPQQEAPAPVGPLAQMAQAAPPARGVDMASMLQGMMPQEDQSSKWLALAAGLGAPTKSGTFGETVGNVASAMQSYKAQQEKLRSQYIPLIMQQVAAQQAREEQAAYRQEAQLAAQQAARAAQQERLAQSATQADLARQQQAQLAREGIASREAIAAQTNDLRRELKGDQNGADKPLPPVAVKLQNEELQAIGTFSGLDKDLQGMQAQVDNGTLNFGPINNLKNSALNKLGMSTEESRNFASFRSKLENMRNAVLLLNKGVQTEGDAQRAMNEIMANIEDKDLVKQRLAEIRALNARAVQLKKMNIDTIRSNYGHPAFDFTKVDSIPAATNLPENNPPGAAPVPDLAAAAAAELARRSKK